MNFHYITADFAVTSQIEKSDAAEIAKSSFKKVINNRPDGEEKTQPDSQHILTAVSDHGIGYLYIPICDGIFSDGDIAELDQVIKAAQAPVLAFCRTGTRSAKLWALCETARRPVDEILALTKAAGYDLNDMKVSLEARAQQFGNESNGET